MSPSIKKRVFRIGIAVAGALLLLAQLVPARRTNPPVTGLVDAPPEVLSILRRSCWDCHSNETRWPWYSRVAPVKFLIVRDVNEGRRHLNFTEWDRASPERRAHLKEEVVEETGEGEMPLWFYVALHPEAELSDAELATLRSWGLGGAATGGHAEPGAFREDEDEHEHDD